MAALTITEYSHLATDAAGQVIPAGLEPALAEQTVTIGGASTQSSALNAETRLVYLFAESACAVAIGANPTALTAKKRMGAGQGLYLGVPANSGLKIAVIS